MYQLGAMGFHSFGWTLDGYLRETLAGKRLPGAFVFQVRNSEFC